MNYQQLAEMVNKSTPYNVVGVMKVEQTAEQMVNLKHVLKRMVEEFNQPCFEELMYVLEHRYPTAILNKDAADYFRAYLYEMPFSYLGKDIYFGEKIYDLLDSEADRKVSDVVMKVFDHGKRFLIDFTIALDQMISWFNDYVQRRFTLKMLREAVESKASEKLPVMLLWEMMTVIALETNHGHEAYYFYVQRMPPFAVKAMIEDRE